MATIFDNKQFIHETLIETHSSRVIQIIQKRILQRRKSICFIGVRNSGKSYLVNTLLKEWISPSNQLMMTGRIIRFTKSDIPFIAQMCSGRLTHIEVSDRTLTIPLDLIRAQPRDKQVTTQLIVGLMSPSMTFSYDIIDTPPVNASEELNAAISDLCRTEQSLVFCCINGFDTVVPDDFIKLLQSKGVKTINFIITHLLYKSVVTLMREKADPNSVETDKQNAVTRYSSIFHKLLNDGFIQESTDYRTLFATDLLFINPIDPSQDYRDHTYDTELSIQWEKFAFGFCIKGFLNYF